ncbi:MAG: aminopeptidase [Sphaerochaetaceae bacterium]
MEQNNERKLAQLLVNYSVNLQKGENCLLNCVDIPQSMVEHLIIAVRDRGGNPFLNLTTNRLERALIEYGNEESLKLWAEFDGLRMGKMDAFIGIRSLVNPKEMSTIQSQYTSYLELYNKPVHHDIRIPQTKWVVSRYPSEFMAYQANMGFKEFEKFFFRVTTEVDYPKMGNAMKKAKEFLDGADIVILRAPETELSFSIKGLKSIICAGDANIPDGEIYTAPVINSVNGQIKYNCPSTINGKTFTDVTFKVKDGKIVEATSNNTSALNTILDTDEGSRYFGEFALGCNPEITFAMDNILFDEKIGGSIHLTPGNAYQECDNTNRSAIHWDLVLIMKKEYGGGEIIIDDQLISKDGIFVHPAFEELNFNTRH